MSVFRCFRMGFLGPVLVFMVLILGSPRAAYAAMSFCNRTQGPIQAAFGYREEGGWLSEGWWKIEPQQCVRVFGQPLTQRFYFYYANALTRPSRDAVPFVWSGKYDFCIDIAPFKISGDGDCKTRGYQTKGFQQVDIGTTRADYVLDFKDDGGK